MSLHDRPAQFATCVQPESSRKTGTEILAELPTSLCEERERIIYDYATSANMPTWMQSWIEVPVTSGGLEGSFYCLPDFLCIGNDQDFFRARINPVTAETIGAWLEGVLPTKKMVNLIYGRAPQKVVAQPWGPPYDNSMLHTARWPKHDKRIAAMMSSRGYKNGLLTAGHMKNVVVGKKLGEKKGSTVGIYGWFKHNGEAIQGPTANFGSHEWTYADYSHGIRYIFKEMRVGSAVMKVQDVLKHPEYHTLISDEGPLEHSSYLEYHD
jgi:hypothetical protein